MRPKTPRSDEAGSRLEYDLGGASLYAIRNGTRTSVPLRAQGHKLVRHMVERNRELGSVALCDHVELLAAVWPDDHTRSREELARLFWELRTKLEPLGASGLVETERKLGYRLHAFPAEHGPAPGNGTHVTHRRVALALVALLAVGAATGIFLDLTGSPPANGFVEYALPQADSRPTYITAGTDGALWFTEYNGNKIGRITPAGTITEYAIPSPNSGPLGITAGADGEIWFAESNANAIGYITPNGSIVRFALPRPNSNPESVVAGPGNAIWFTEDAHRIGRITHAGKIREFDLPGRLTPADIALGPDGNLWFDSPYVGPKDVVADQTIGRMTPTGKVTLFQLPTAHSAPGGIAAGDGDIWDVEVQSGKIARITISGHVTEYSLGHNVLPAAIAAGSHGSMWFTEKAGNLIGEINASGVIRTYPAPTRSSGPHGIVVAQNGTVWVTEIDASRIARLRPN